MPDNWQQRNEEPRARVSFDSPAPTPERSLEQLQVWWKRVHEIPPWGWRQDPKLAGITLAEFQFLRSLEDPPTARTVGSVTTPTTTFETAVLDLLHRIGMAIDRSLPLELCPLCGRWIYEIEGVFALARHHHGTNQKECGSPPVGRQRV